MMAYKQKTNQTNIMELISDYTDCVITPYVSYFRSMELEKATKCIKEERAEYDLRINYLTEFLR